MTRCFFFIALLVFYSCHRPAKVQSPSPQQDTPEALQEDKSSFSIASKRGSEDLVASLYEEIKNDSPGLLDLEKRVSTARQQKEDSADAFTAFNLKNRSYYNSTESYVASIQDSALKQAARTLISQSLQQYDQRVQLHTRLPDALNKKDITLADLQNLLMLSKTLPAMEKYQAAHLPSAQPLQAAEREFDQIIQQAKTLLKN